LLISCTSFGLELRFKSFYITVGLGLSLKIQDWIWIEKYYSPLITTCFFTAAEVTFEIDAFSV